MLISPTRWALLGLGLAVVLSRAYFLNRACWSVPG